VWITARQSSFCRSRECPPHDDPLVANMMTSNEGQKNRAVEA
jgi:hypothetical protein